MLKKLGGPSERYQVAITTEGTCYDFRTVFFFFFSFLNSYIVELDMLASIAQAGVISLGGAMYIKRLHLKKTRWTW